MKKLHRQNYQVRFVLLFILVGLMLSLLSMALFYYFDKQRSQQILVLEAQESAQVLKRHYHSYLNFYDHLLLSIAQNKAFRTCYLQCFEQEINPNNQRLLAELAEANPNIMQLRFIDANGQERVRVERENQGDKITVIEKARLQKKALRYYFKATKNLKAKQFFYSKLDLNIENGKVQEPYKPVIRIATPLWQGDEFKGILIVNIFVLDFLQEWVYEPYFKLYVFDQNRKVVFSNDKHAVNWEPSLFVTNSSLPNGFTHEELFFKAPQQTLHIGYIAEQNLAIMQVFKKTEILLILFIIVIPVAFILAYFLAQIPKRLFDELEKREHIIMQQSRNAAVGETLKTITHQWKQPLNVINGVFMNITDAFEDKRLDKKLIDQLTTTGENNLMHLSQTIDDFNHYFKAPKNEVFDVNSVLDLFEDIMLPQLASADINIILDIENAKLYGPENEFLHVLINLTNNAKYAISIKQQEQHKNLPENLGSGLETLESSNNLENSVKNNSKWIKFKSFIKKERLIMVIENNGEAIPEKVQQQLFVGEFTSKPASGSGSGSGFGLIISRKIIENSFKGHIKLKFSNTETTAFEISLPLFKPD